MNGILYIIATPIGNLKDITLRALEVLKEVDLIVAEDTRHTLKLLQQYQIRKELFSYYEQVEQAKLPILMGYLKEGKRIALVTDAGTPSVSDPGQRLIQLLNFRNMHSEGPGFFVATKTLKTRAVALRTSSISDISGEGRNRAKAESASEAPKRGVRREQDE